MVTKEKIRFDKAFSEVLRQLFEETSKSRKEIAEKAGIQQSYICLMLKGERGIPSDDVKIRLAKAFGITHRELLERLADVIQWYNRLRRPNNPTGCHLKKRANLSQSKRIIA